MTTKARLACPSCGRKFVLGVSWTNINYCRAVYLADFVRRNPGLSAWEISQRVGLIYGDVQKGLAKGREYGIFATEEEERPQGGIRYRYEVSPEAQEVIRLWSERHIL